MNAGTGHRHAVVTGASRGIGAAIARNLAAHGVHLTLMGRQLQPLQALAATLNTPTHLAAVDVSQHDAVVSALSDAAAALGPVHVLVNNAGQATSQPIDQTSLAIWQQMLDVNLTGTFICTQAVLPLMRPAASAALLGRIINIASTAGLKGYAYVAAYTAAKHGVVGLTRALALELAKDHITVNALCPGYTETDIVTQAIEQIVRKTGKTPEAARAALLADNPQRRLVQPEEVAQAVWWLMSPQSNCMNGQAIALDGGELAG
jgi:NAD(P)-dependent dehydrogenase (short-subunit alcohol dehydrogenase family)